MTVKKGRLNENTGRWGSLCRVILVAGGLALEMKEPIPVVSLICGLINIQCVGSKTLPVSRTCFPLRQGKKENMSIPIGVGG